MKISKKITIAALAMAASLYLPSCTYKNVDYSTRTVTTHGTGSVEVEADNATIEMSVLTRGQNVAEASAENAKIMTDVQKAVMSLGISKDDVTTENYSVYQETNYIDGKQVPGDYRVSNKIKIHIKKVELVSNVIDSALQAGANQLSSLNYGISDNALATKQARTLAVQQAQEAAQLIAGTSGAKLGKVLRIEELQNMDNRRNVVMMAKYASDASFETAATPIQSGKSTVTVSVDAIFELK